MPCCDQRLYCPATNGLFKLRSSDGDLAWESRAVGTGARSQEFYNTMVDRFGDSTIVTGVVDTTGDDLLPKIMVVAESGGFVQSIAFTDDPSEAIDDNELTFFLTYDRTDDYLYVAGGRILTAPNYNWYVVNRFNITDLSYMEGTVILAPGGDVAGFRAVQGTDQFDLIHENLGRVSRFTAGSTTVVDFFSGTAGASIDRNFRIPSDGTHYYVNATGSKQQKIDIATLSLVASSAVHGDRTRMAVRDGYLGATDGSLGACTVMTTAGLATSWNSSAHFSRALTVDVCANFSVFVGLATGTNPATATSFRVRAIDHAGSILWTRDILASDDRSLLRQLWPVPVISQDESKVYVYGPLSHNGLGSTALKMSMYCLNADDGSISWCFSPGPTTDAQGANSHAGMSLYEDGDHLYLGTLRCRAPSYR